MHRFTDFNVYTLYNDNILIYSHFCTKTLKCKM